MGHVVLTVTLRDIVKHIGTAVIIEIHVNIRERDSVGVKETFKKEVIFDGVHLSDTETVGHDATRSRTTTGPDTHAELMAGNVDEVLYDKEVARETHRLHYVKLEADTLLQFGGERTTVATLRTLIGEF